MTRWIAAGWTVVAATLWVSACGGMADSTLAARGAPHIAVCTGGRFVCGARTLAGGDVALRRLAGPTGYGATDLASAYAADASVNPGVTVGIAEAFGYTNIESDLNFYRSYYGLPSCTISSGCLTVVNQSGQTSPLPAQPPSTNDWTIQTALDVEMVSAICPLCKILVVQADNDTGSGLDEAQAVAASLGATVMVDSWGASEDSTAPTQESTYFNVPGLTIFASTGVNGYSTSNPQFPASSGLVTAVGGTTLTKAATTRGWQETAWTGSGHGTGCSAYFAIPGFQGGVSTTCARRAVADVSAVGDPNTGVAIYNNGPANAGWQTVGGTSSTGLVAGTFALSGHARALSGFAYRHPEAFNDVTSGNDGSCGGSVACTAATGWDGPTGMGTPNAAVMATIVEDAGTILPSGDGGTDGGADGGVAPSGSDGGSDGGTSPPRKSSCGCMTAPDGAATLALVLGGLLLLRRRRA